MFPFLRFELQLRREGASQPPASLRRHRGGDENALRGPRLRRVLGKHLIERFCPFGRPICEKREAGEEAKVAGALCALEETCPYGVAFAESRSRRPPFALHVPGEIESETSDLVGITLYGGAWRLYPWFLQSLREALQNGLGKRRWKWEIEKVCRIRGDGVEERLASGDLESVPARLSPDMLGLALEPFLAPQRVEVRFCSPTRLIDDGQLVRRSRVGLQVLVARILDRFGGLYGDDSCEILRPEIRGPIEAEAKRVPLRVEETRWVKARDYSARHRRVIALGGKVGRLVYGEEAAPFFGILRAGEVLHVGKNPTSGCGRIEVNLI